MIESMIPDAVLDGPDAGAIQQAKVNALRRYVDRPLQVTLRLAIEYVLPDLQEPVAEPGGGGFPQMMMMSGG